MRQPPRASRSTFSPIAIETRRGLDTDMIEPFFITAKSEQQQSQADDPNEVSSVAAVQGVSRIRRNCVVSLPSRAPIPFDPIASGRRAPRSEEHTSELQSLMRISYAVFCLQKKNTQKY